MKIQAIFKQFSSKIQGAFTRNFISIQAIFKRFVMVVDLKILTFVEYAADKSRVLFLWLHLYVIRGIFKESYKILLVLYLPNISLYLAVPGVDVNTLENRDREGCCFTSSWLGLGNHIKSLTNKTIICNKDYTKFEKSNDEIFFNRKFIVERFLCKSHLHVSMVEFQLCAHMHIMSLAANGTLTPNWD